MLGAMARAGAVLGEEKYRAAAEKNLAFLQTKLWDAGTRTLHHRWRDGERDNVQLLDGYAFLLAGVIELYEATLEPAHLDFAIALGEAMLGEVLRPGERRLLAKPSRRAGPHLARQRMLRRRGAFRQLRRHPRFVEARAAHRPQGIHPGCRAKPAPVRHAAPATPPGGPVSAPGARFLARRTPARGRSRRSRQSPSPCLASRDSFRLSAQQSRARQYGRRRALRQDAARPAAVPRFTSAPAPPASRQPTTRRR